MDKFSDRLKEAMTVRNIRLIDLANATKINKGTISNYLSGKYQPKNDNALLIANALNINLPWLLGYDDVPMEVNQYVDYTTPSEENGSYITIELEKNFDEHITKEQWDSYYDKIMAMPESARIDVLKMVVLSIVIYDTKKKINDNSIKGSHK